jgi:hypothetical protein
MPNPLPYKTHFFYEDFNPLSGGTIIKPKPAMSHKKKMKH